MHWAFPHRAWAVAAWVGLSSPSLLSAQEVRTPPPASGRSLERPREIRASDVLARVLLLRDHLEEIRQVMGRPPPPPPVLHAANVAVRENVVMAINVRRRVSQLAYEQLRSDPEWRELPPQQASQADVFRLVDKSLKEVLRVRRELGISTPISEQARPEGVSAAQVFDALVEVGSLVNALLVEQSSSSGNFVGVTFGVHVALKMHLKLVDRAIPDMPPPVSKKMSPDVFKALLDVFGRVRALAEAAGRQVLDLKVDQAAGRRVTPDDVSNLVAIVLSELLWLHGLVEGAEQPTKAYPAGQKFPSHVYRRARFLESVLVDILRRGDRKKFREPQSDGRAR